jgi:hypothetical protein
MNQELAMLTNIDNVLYIQLDTIYTCVPWLGFVLHSIGQNKTNVKIVLKQTFFVNKLQLHWRV